METMKPRRDDQLRRLGLALTFGATLALGVGGARAQDTHENAGTRAATFLKMESGARAAALAGAYTGVSGDVDGVFWNPAGLSGVTDRQLTATQNFSFGGLNHETAAYAQRLNANAVFGAIFQGLFGEIERRAGDTLEPDSAFTASTVAFGVSYAQQLGALTVGATAKGVQERFDVERESTVAVDAGARLTLGRLVCGASVLNAGNELGDSKLPLVVRVGGSATLSKDGPLLAADVVVPDDDFTSVRVGIEQWFAKQVALRAGYEFGKGDRPGKGYTVGIGLKSQGTKMLENVDFQLDYAFIPDDGVGDAHRVSFLTRF
jgi:hypothetical protein